MPRRCRKARKRIIEPIIKSDNKADTGNCNKCNESIYIGDNLERWLHVRNKLNIKTDQDFLNYLLNLAEVELKTGSDNELRSQMPDCQRLSYVTERESDEDSCTSTPRGDKIRLSNKLVFFNSTVPVEDSPILELTDLDYAEDRVEGEEDGGERDTEGAGDEEKENVRVFDGSRLLDFESIRPIGACDGSRTEIVSVSDAKNKVAVNNVDCNDTSSNVILKETEQNLDYSKLKKHTKKQAGLQNLAAIELKRRKKKRKCKMEERGKCQENAEPLLNEDLESSLNPSSVKTEQQQCYSEYNGSVNDNSSDNRLIINNASAEDCPQPQKRVAITIKLCCECDSRHVQDGCPLRNPEKVIEDSISLEYYLRSNSPIEFRDEDSRFDSKHTFAQLSLPDCLELKVIEPEHGLSVVARQTLPPFTQFGPIVGQPIKEMEIPDDFSMKDVWEICESSSFSYLSTQDPDFSNWLRWVRPAPTRDLRNCASVQKGSELYFVTSVSLAEGEELLYWADSFSSQHQAWSSKKMSKTNCGGCNLKFAHPLYYHRHCAVFHDPKFSLTIRKYHCKVCGLSVLGKENIMKHAADKHEGKGAYQCQFCKKFFLRLNYLEMHRTYGCSSNPHRTRPLCDYCGRKFCQPQKLKIHIKRMHSEISEVLREFQCKRCLKVLGSRAALQRHIKEVHHKAVLCACTCDKCGKMFQNKSNLKIHMLTHSGIKPFRCQQGGCAAAFTTKQCLQFHYKKVHGYAESKMPRIERSVAYTFDAYAGDLRPDSANSLCSSEASNSPGNGDEEADEQPGSDRPVSCGPTSSPLPLLPPQSREDEERCGEEGQPYGETASGAREDEKWLEEQGDGEGAGARDYVYQFDDGPKANGHHHLLRKNGQPGGVMLGSTMNKPESSNASLLVEAALDAAERDIEMSFAANSKLSADPLYPILNRPLPHREPTPKSPDYSLHMAHQDLNPPALVRSLDASIYPSAVSPTPRHPPGYSLVFPDRTPHFELHLSPTAQMDTSSFHIAPDDSRYDIHHRRLDDYSSDDNDGVAQNLSVGLKSKSLQLDLSAGYKYDTMEDRSDNFESLEGLDMTRSSVYHHSSFVSRYPHSLYDQRSYAHSDMLRVVNLTHSVDLSLPRNVHPIEPVRVLSPLPAPYQSYPPSPPPLPAAPYLASAGTNRNCHSPNITTYHHFSSY